MKVGRGGAPHLSDPSPSAAPPPGGRGKWVVVGILAAGLVTALGLSGYLYLVPAPADDHFAEQTNGLQWATRRNTGTVFTDATLWFGLEKGRVTLHEVAYEVDGVSARQLGPPLIARKKPGVDTIDTIPGYPLTPQQLAKHGLEDVRPLEGAIISADPAAGAEPAQYVILIGFRIDSDGRTVRGEPDIIYSVAGQWRKKKFHSMTSLIICSPEAPATSGDCT